MLQLGLEKLGGRMEGLALTIARQAHPSITRNEHLTQALAEGFTHFLSLDDDQTFPADVVERMLASAKPVLACNYRKKTDERVEYTCSDINGDMLNSTGRMGLEPITAMGMGMALIDLRAMAHVPAPYFAVIWNKDKGSYLIEDAVFSLLLREHNVALWCDHELSQDIGHVGEKEYRLPSVVPATISVVGPSAQAA